jgi:cytochrome c-type biogenesis protein CcmH
MRNNLTLIICMLWMGLAHAASIEQPLPNAAQEQTARAIFHELRCVVCEGQSVADSDAVLAVQMRDHVRRLIAEGKSESEVLAEFRTSYGDKILMTPPLEPTTLLLWLAPLLLLAIGGSIVWRVTHPKNGNQP